MTPDLDREQEAAAPIAVVSHDGQDFRFTHDDPADHIFSILKRTGAFYEGDMLREMAALLHPDELVLDVGANIGNHAVFLAGVCRCRVVAFEVNPRAVRTLEANVLLNGLGDRIRIEPVAVGATRQRGLLSAPKEHNLGTGAVAADPAGDIEIVPIDDIAIDGRVALIKIDIEGTDIEALKGAAKLLERDHPAIVIEAKSAAEYAEVARLLDPLGYVAAGSFNYSPTHFFVRPPARAGKGKLVPQLSHRLALQYIDSMARQSGIDRQLGRVRAQLADIASRTESDQANLVTQSHELQRVVDGFGSTLSALARSVQEHSTAMEAQLEAILRRTATEDDEANRHLMELRTRMDNLGVAFEHSTSRAADELTALRQDISAILAGHAATIADAAGRLQASVTAVHERQTQAAEHVAEVQSHLEKKVDAARAEFFGRMEALSAATTDRIAELAQMLSEGLSRQAAASSAMMAKLESALQGLDRKGDAAIEASLLAAAAQEADLRQVRTQLASLVDRQADARLEAVVAGNLKQLQADIARSLGRQLGELRVDLDILLGKSNLNFADALTLLGVDPDAGFESVKLPASVPADDARPAAAALQSGPVADERSLSEEKRTSFVRRSSAPPAAPPAQGGATPVEPKQERRSEEILARFDFDKGWKGQAWRQQGTELRDSSLVFALEDKATLGFVSRTIDCSGGGLLEIEVDSATVSGPTGGRILRLRSGADEPIGHDFPLGDGLTTVRTFAPHRTRRIKLYVIRSGSPAGTAYRVSSLMVRRPPADRHQSEVRDRIGQPVLASMASIPSRREMLRDCVNSLLVQCDRVRVFLNEYPDVPEFLRHPRVEVRRSQDWDDRGDAGKFFWIDRDDGVGGYRLIVDDDLVFPPDFAATMAAKVAAMDNKAIYATHAVLLRQPIGAYYEASSRATTFHFDHRLQQDRGVHIGATNAMCFHADAVRMRWSDFKYCNSADIWLSLHAQAKGLPILTPARPRDWIRENRHANPDDTIYNHSRKRTRSRFDSSLVQDAVIRHADRFTVKVRGRAKCGFTLHIASAGELNPALRSWLAWRPLDIEWVVFLVYNRDDAATRAAVRSFETDHEIHLVEIGPGEPPHLAALWQGLGVEAVFCAGSSIRFTRQPQGNVGQEDRTREPLAAGPLISHGRFAVQALNGKRSGLTQAVLAGHSKDRLSWLANLVGDAATGGGTSPLDTTLVIAGDEPREDRADPGSDGGSAASRPASAKGGAVHLNDVFDRVLVLNLDRRKDRWQTMSEQLTRLGIKAERMSAVDGTSPNVAAEYEAYRSSPLATLSKDVPAIRFDGDFYFRYPSQRARVAWIEGASGRKAVTSAGAWGYLRSYERILEQALEQQIESLLVFDDDVALHSDFKTMFAEAMEQLPADWLVVQLGTLQYNWSEPWVQWRGSRLYQPNGCVVGSHAVGMRFDIYPFLLDQLRRMDLPYDVGALSAATRAFPDQCFVISPNLAIQRFHDSDVATVEFPNGRNLADMAATFRWNLSEYNL